MPLSQDTLRFIREHRRDDVRSLALQARRYPSVDMPAAITQISGWQIAKEKIPAWAENEHILYPAHLSLEQCSSQATAQYKAEIITNLLHTEQEHPAQNSTPASAGTFTDLTGGFGIDCAYLSSRFGHATYVERQETLCQIAAHNFPVLGLNHISVCHADSVRHLQEMEPVDCIFIDPARRDGHGGKTVAIGDCEPDIAALEELLLRKARHVLVKLSPMLDLTLALNDLKHVHQAHIVSVGNECKELLLVLDRGSHDAVRVICVNDGDVFGYVHDMKTGADSDGVVLASAGEKGSQGGSAEPSHAAQEQPRYLYEPNASLMKGGCFALLEDHYGMRQIGPNSHLLISGTPAPQFPGRGFVIETIAGMGKKELKRALAGVDRANIAVRNFPLTAVQLRRKLKLADGGDVYLFGTTSVDGRHVIVRTVKQ